MSDSATQPSKQVETVRTFDAPPEQVFHPAEMGAFAEQGSSRQFDKLARVLSA
ncbi:MAG: hypothetical protein ABI611_02360 [Solirubrobacteraceae bacterium]